MGTSKLKANPLEGNIIKNLIIFALPVMGVSLLHMLFSSFDTMVVGKFGHPNAMSAIGASGSIIWLLIGSIMGCSGGVSMVIGNLYGQGEKGRINKIVNALPLSVGFVSVLMAVFAIIFAEPILGIVNCPAEILDGAKLYFRIYFCAVPFMTTFSFLTAAVQAKGDSFTPFIMQVVSQAINLSLNLLFVIVFDWNLLGVALGTVFAQAAAFIMMVIYLARNKEELHLKLRELRFFKGTGEVWRKGIPASLEGVALSLSTVYISSLINKYSPDVIAGNTVSDSIEGILMVAFMGFESGAVVFISQNLGAKNLKRVRKSYVTTMLFVIGLSELMGACVLLFAKPLVSLFIDSTMGNATVISSVAIHKLFCLTMFYGLCGTMNSIFGCIRGLQDAKTPLIISIIASVIFRTAWVAIVPAMTGKIESIYMAFPLTWFISTALGMIAFEIIFKKRKKELEKAI